MNVVRFAYSAILLVVLAATSVFADPDITLPDKVQGSPGAFLKVPATTKGETVVWVALDPGLNLFPADLLKDTRTTVVTATQPGNYRLLAYTAVGGKPSEPAYTTVVIGDPPSPNPGPDPQPGDSLHKSLQEAYNADPSPVKANSKTLLTEMYKGASLLLDSSKTLGELHDKLQTARKSLIGESLSGTRKVLNGVLTDLGTDPTAVMDDATKTKAKSVFARMVALLEGVR